MSTAPVAKRSLWKGTGPCLSVMATAAVTATILGLPSYFVGKQEEDERRFLKNYRLPSWGEMYIDCTMQYVRDSDEKNDVVFLGDSSCVVGIIAREFERQTGLTAYNLGSPGFIGIDGFLLVWRSYLEHHPKPRMVVFCAPPRAFGLTDDLGWPELRDRFFWSYGPGVGQKIPPHDICLVHYVREGLRGSFGHLMGGVEYYTSITHPAFAGKSYNAWKTEVLWQRGFFEKKRIMAEDELPGDLYSDPAPISPFFMKHLCELASITRDAGIPLMIRVAPVPLANSSEYCARLQCGLSELQMEFSNVKVSQPETLVYQTAFFGDRLHCNRKGAERFTEFVAGEVFEALATGVKR
jgi:hypothetical protein